MGLFKKDNEPKTAEGYRKAAEKHQADIKYMRNTFLKTGVFTAAALIAILAGSHAWFVLNTRVTSNGTSISSNGAPSFYLATLSTNQQGVYDDNKNDNNAINDSVLTKALSKFQRINQDVSFQNLPQFMVGTKTVTANDSKVYIVGDTDGISLMVDSESNVNNTVEEGYIGPGSEGQVMFYIIPTVDGPNGAELTITMEPYKLQVEGSDEEQTATASAIWIDGDDASIRLKKLLYGHILIFRDKDNNGDYADQIFPKVDEDGTLSYFFEETGDDWRKNQPIPVTFYWIWPYRFENIVYTGQSESVFKNSNESYDALISWINDNRDWIVNIKDKTELSSLENVGLGMSNLGMSQWNAGYNRGDQLIGDTVAYFIWTISAVE